MEDDREALQNVNEPFESEMEEENLEIEETRNAEECVFLPELGQSNLNVGEEKNEMVSFEEDKPVTAEVGELAVLENHVATESEFIKEALAVEVAEMIEPPVVVAAEESGGEMIISDIGDPQLELKAEEESKTVDDANAAMDVTDTGDVQLFSETKMDAKEDEISVDPQLEMEAEEEFMPIVDSTAEVAVTDGDGSQLFPEPSMYASVDELPSAREGMESWNDKAKREMGEGEKVEEAGGAEVDLEDSRTLENDTEMVAAGDEKDGQKVDFLADNSEVGTADPVIIEEIPTSEVKIEMELVTEVNADVINVSEKEQVLELGGGLQYAGADVRGEVAAEESLISDTKMVGDENMSVKVVSGFKLDDPMIATENRDEAAVDEENLRMETEGGVELDMVRDDMAEEAQLEDDKVKTGTVNEAVADKILGKHTKLETEKTRSVMDDPGQGMDDSPAVLQDETIAADEEDETMVPDEDTGTQDTEMETETDVAESMKASGGKRKRGKFSKSPSISKATAKASSRKTVGEDVCFICFDGGELVLCDRRGCPKAYHPSCVNRDEAFFRAKGRWNCGWHMCSICEKNAHFMCYTCTFSLCKSCSKDAVILCVRGNKGFCETCMRTVMLIENNEQGNKDSPIDFDDRGSWEYLFKDYYIELKSKLSLSSVEVEEAKNPWKGTDVVSGHSKQESSEAQADANDGGSGSDDSIEKLKIIKPKRRKVRKQSKSLTKEKELANAGVATGDKALSLSENSEWASKELLEFVSHMKNGDISVLSQFDVQGLFLEYIKRNKLRDPRRKSQIICDARLEILFGKPRVGHFEMLKLLESHFLIRDEQNDDVQGSIVDTENNQLDADDNADHLTKGVKDRKRKTRKKGDIRGPQSNLDDYAAIDMHNISLIYLRRKLMEDLLEDVEKFHDKAVGMFVRIRISGSIQKQDLYRLVQVVGTSKAAEPYKIGKKTTDTVVEILNLDKTEIISIDTISNQEFTEEECKRLRQSIKCGLISRLTVGEILDKTMEIQAARVNDWLESETSRLSHLRDRASDLGRRKELRECVEKLQILKTPEERRRRLNEIPEIHADPKMDPSYESDENDRETEDSRRDDFMRFRGSGFSRRGRGPISPGSDSSLKGSWGGAGKVSSKYWESGRNLSGNNFSANATHSGEIVNENFWNLESEKDPQESNNLEKLSAADYESAERATRTVSRTESLSGVSSVTSQASLPTGVGETSVKINETEKIWHYQDPSGKVQGPFTMVQLRKWNNTGYFPANLKIWRATEKQEDYILMADALAGKFHKELPAVDIIFPATDTLHSPPILPSHSGQTTGTSLHQDKERPSVDQNPVSHTKLSTEKWSGNEITNLPSPTPKQSNAGWTGGEGGLLTGAIRSPGVKGVIPTSTNIGSHSLAHASVLNSVVQSGTAFSPTPNSQQGILVGSADSLHIQSTVTSEPHTVQMHGHPSTAVHPVQHVISQIPLAETQGWGSSAQSGQSQGYGWGAPNTQNSAANFSNLGTTAVPQSEFWRPPTQGSQPNIYAPATPNVTWSIAPAENNTSLGVRPENPNTGWGSLQANPNMGWGNPAPGNTNLNRGPSMQVPPTGNTISGWVAPTGNPGANIQGPVPGNVNSGWAAPPVQGPMPGNGWGPLSGNAGAPAPVQGSAQGTTNQGWVAPQGNQGSWAGDQNHSGGQFSGQRNGQGRDSGFGGDRPWNRQSSFSGGPGGSRHYNKRETVCPYNANGRCRKGAHCDYLHT